MSGTRYFPLFIDLTDRAVVMAGAGSIAARRLRALLEFGACVTVIAPEIGEQTAALMQRWQEPQLRHIPRCYRTGDADGAQLVLTATGDRQTDQQIVCECREKHIPVNAASDRTLCDFYFPALIEQENLVIGVSSGGSDHNKVSEVSRKLRTFLREEREEDS